MVTDWLLADALGMHRSRGASGPVATYRVFVRDLVLDCSIGIYDYERANRQRVRVNAELVASVDPEQSGDDIAGVLNYEAIVDGIKHIVASGHINLVETLAERVIDLCLVDPRVVAARAVVEKLDVYPEAGSVGVTIERRRPRGGEIAFAP
jgi:dihydroneopterin aldolase